MLDIDHHYQTEEYQVFQTEPAGGQLKNPSFVAPCSSYTVLRVNCSAVCWSDGSTVHKAGAEKGKLKGKPSSKLPSSPPVQIYIQIQPPVSSLPRFPRHSEKSRPPMLTSASNQSSSSFFSFAGDYTGRPVVVMNEAVLRRSPVFPGQDVRARS